MTIETRVDDESTLAFSMQVQVVVAALSQISGK